MHLKLLHKQLAALNNINNNNNNNRDNNGSEIDKDNSKNNIETEDISSIRNSNGIANRCKGINDDKKEKNDGSFCCDRSNHKNECMEKKNYGVENSNNKDQKNVNVLLKEDSTGEAFESKEQNKLKANVQNVTSKQNKLLYETCSLQNPLKNHFCVKPVTQNHCITQKLPVPYPCIHHGQPINALMQGFDESFVGEDTEGSRKFSVAPEVWPQMKDETPLVADNKRHNGDVILKLAVDRTSNVKMNNKNRKDNNKNKNNNIDGNNITLLRGVKKGIENETTYKTFDEKRKTKNFHQHTQKHQTSSDNIYSFDFNNNNYHNHHQHLPSPPLLHHHHPRHHACSKNFFLVWRPWQF